MIITHCDTCGKELSREGFTIEDFAKVRQFLTPYSSKSKQSEESLVIHKYYTAEPYRNNECDHKFQFCSRECFLKKVEEISTSQPFNYFSRQ